MCHHSAHTWTEVVRNLTHSAWEVMSSSILTWVFVILSSERYVISLLLGKLLLVCESVAWKGISLNMCKLLWPEPSKKHFYSLLCVFFQLYFQFLHHCQRFGLTGDKTISQRFTVCPDWGHHNFLFTFQKLTHWWYLRLICDLLIHTLLPCSSLKKGTNEYTYQWNVRAVLAVAITHEICTCKEYHLF